tara:strand:- start:8006 stop:11023 length:3018 start_codon:yes stop_codon:yes gene_type:complete
MAIYHCNMSTVSRSSGRSAVAAAAYRTAEKLLNERDGELHDFTRRSGVAGSEIVLPEGADADWALDRSALWNAAEKAEKRKDSRVAREFEVSLPHELDADQRVALARAFAQHLADWYGAAVDMAIHEPHGKTDGRNHHAHLLMTTRQLAPDGLGDKTHFEREGKWLMAKGLPVEKVQLKQAREVWADIANRHLAMAGLDVQIDHRSYEDRGLSIEPTRHMGVHASQMQRRGLVVERTALEVETAQRNAERIAADPSEALTILTDEKSVFDRRDIARTLHRYIDDQEDFQGALVSVMASPELVPLQGEQTLATGEVIPARYSTREMVALERAMGVSAEAMVSSSGKRVSAEQVQRVLADRHDGVERPSLSPEQRAAVEHVTGADREDGGGRIASVVGLAGAGKSTMLGAAREAWAESEVTVFGAALSGKAAEGLQAASGIESRTLASWEYGWKRGRDHLQPGDVLVIDEAGMVSSRQLARFVEHADKAGAKLVLVGDPEQLQPINAGAAFRAVAERTGVVSLEEVRRQRQAWMREASVAFGQHRTREALDVYDERGRVQSHESAEAARVALVTDYVMDMQDRQHEPSGGSRIALAHRRVDVRALNDEIRAALAKEGALGSEQIYQTETGERAFAAGDRLVFLRNERSLGVKNGTLATVEKSAPGELQVRLDGLGEKITVDLAEYKDIDHGYATTIHKSQGATVDRTFVYGSGTMDRHLTYVAMTRHRDSVKLYYDRDEFPEYEQLAERLSRSNAKETTLDYAAAGRSLDERGRVAKVNKAADENDISEAVDRFGARRGIDVGELLEVATRVMRDLAHQAKERFDAFRDRGKKDQAMSRSFDRLRSALSKPSVQPLEPSPTLSPSSPPVPSPSSTSIDRLASGKTMTVLLTRLVDRIEHVWAMEQGGLAALEGDRRLIGEMLKVIETVKPGTTPLIASVQEQNPALIDRIAKQHEGPARGRALWQAIKQEYAAQRDPAVMQERALKVQRQKEQRQERDRDLNQGRSR